MARDPDDLARELRSHLEHEEAELRAAGIGPREAARLARVKLGSPARIREQLRARRWRPMETFWQDVGYGLRLLGRSPGFSLAAALVLAVGIGLNTALFSLLNALYYPHLAVPAAQELFYLFERNQSGQTLGALDPMGNEQFRASLESLASVTEHWVWRASRLAAGDDVQFVSAEVVESNYFDVLGVGMQLGRGFRPDDDELTNPERSLILSYQAWMRTFDGRSDVLGTKVRLNDRYFTVVGVAAQGFNGLSDPWHPVSCWVTSAAAADNRIGLGLIGRMNPGVRFGQVEALVATRGPEIRELRWNQFSTAFRARSPNWRQQGSYLVRRADEVADPGRPDVPLLLPGLLAALIAVAVLVLAIATTNIAGLMLARGVGRRGEVAVRRALGAGRFRIVRQLLTEAALLGLLGGAAGGAVAALLIKAYLAVTPSLLVVEVPLDWHVLAFAVVLSVGTGTMVGLAPALQAAGVNVLQAFGRVGAVAHPAGRAVPRWIVIPQVACSLVLLLVAAVHGRVLTQLERADPGYRTDDVVVLTIGRWEPRSPPPFGQTLDEGRRGQAEDAAKVRQFNRALLDRVRGVAGIGAFGLTSWLPIASSTEEASVLTTTEYQTGIGAQATASRVAVSDGYFDATGIRLLRGRTFDGRDQLYGHRVAVVSESVAQDLWPGGDPLGKSIAFDSGQTIDWLEVVGVVRDANPVLDAGGATSTVYVSVMQEWRGDAPYLVVRGRADQAELIREVKAAVTGADPFAEVTSVHSMSQLADVLLHPRRVAAGLLGVAGMIGLALATIGLYGLVAFTAAQRTHELGVRAAMGAPRSGLVALLLKDGIVVTTLGVVFGVALAVSALRATAAYYPDLPALDVRSFLSVPALLFATVIAASSIPAWRAARRDPAEILRRE